MALSREDEKRLLIKADALESLEYSPAEICEKLEIKHWQLRSMRARIDALLVGHASRLTPNRKQFNTGGIFNQC